MELFPGERNQLDESCKSLRERERNKRVLHVKDADGLLKWGFCRLPSAAIVAHSFPIPATSSSLPLSIKRRASAMTSLRLIRSRSACLLFFAVFLCTFRSVQEACRYFDLDRLQFLFPRHRVLRDTTCEMAIIRIVGCVCTG